MTDADSPWRPELPHNQLPALPPARELESRAVLKACIEARAALAELKQAAELIPNQTMLINTIPLLEAKDSSEIENIVTTTGTKHPLQFQSDRHRDEKRLAFADELLDEPHRCCEWRFVVPDDVADQHIRIERRHQRQGFMASMSTTMPCGSFNMPARSRMDFVFARTMIVPSGATDQTSRVPGFTWTSARTSAGTVV